MIELGISPSQRSSVYRRPGWRRGLIAVLACAVLVVAGAVGASIASNGSTAPKKSAVRQTKVHWRLTAALLGPQYEVGSGNPDAVVGVVCSAGKTCVLSTGYGLDYGGGGTLFVSQDGGRNWQPSPLPANTAATTLASCPTDSWCAVGGGLLDAVTGDPAAKKPMRDPELLVSSDGGRTWAVRHVPLPVAVEQLPAYGSLPAETTYWPGEVDSVQCSAPQVCNLLGQIQINGSGNTGNGDELIFLHTSDGGIHWTSQALPPIPGAASYQLTLAPGEAETMSCPTGTSCTIVAAPWTPSAVVSWHTANGGHSWTFGQVLPSGPFSQPRLSCPDERTCWLAPPTSTASTGAHLLRSEDGGLTWAPVYLPSFQPISTTSAGYESPNISCTAARSCDLSLDNAGIAETTDGGMSWHQVVLPSVVGGVLQVSCVLHTGCVAIANPAQGLVLDQYNGGSMILTDESPPGDSR